MVKEATGKTAAGMLALPFQMILKIGFVKQFHLIDLFFHCCRFFWFSKFVN